MSGQLLEQRTETHMMTELQSANHAAQVAQQPVLRSMLEAKVKLHMSASQSGMPMSEERRQTTPPLGFDSCKYGKK